MPSRRRLQQCAIAISISSVFYNAAEGAISVLFGVDSGSRSLVFFGIQSVIEVLSSVIVVWRFWRSGKPGDETSGEGDTKDMKLEKVATMSIGSLLVMLALAAIGTSIASLVAHDHPSPSNASLIIASATLFIMFLFWLPKRYLARALDSSTMAGEALCTLSCMQFSAVLLVGSLVYRVWRGGWWVDAATAIVIALLFGWEGVRMVRWARSDAFDGGCGCCSGGEGKADGLVRVQASATQLRGCADTESCQCSEKDPELQIPVTQRRGCADTESCQCSGKDPELQTPTTQSRGCADTESCQCSETDPEVQAPTTQRRGCADTENCQCSEKDPEAAE
ncbi:hypothetical protein BV22DRAFT_1098443 [Leucogyrophana mollusca]|uniref:Uncharacterized protein n=1 Tax=Leucogyrophana mollusca TaxID=85980 RepID=A0ACB8B3X5_9AGAM|nr:hypothetical protein BV22DRAFT_1098443 [Leucogyrophana mollusca]